MPTRTQLAVGASQFFGIAIAIALGLVIAAPIGSIRGFALIGLACAVAGLVLALLELRSVDPHAFMVLRFRLDQIVQRVKAAGTGAGRSIRSTGTHRTAGSVH